MPIFSFDPSAVPLESSDGEPRAPNIERPWNKKKTIDHALAYASRGWFVFPAPANGEKKGCVSGETTNGNRWGCTTDPEEIIAYYKQIPAANVGIATGKDSGFFVLEADTPKGHAHDGLASIKDLEEKHGEFPETLAVESPSGSIHRYFEYPNDGIVIENSASKIALGVDVRGEGGMVLAPPSVRPGKGSYRWLNSLAIAKAPDWLLQAATKPPLPEPKPIVFSVVQSSSDLSAYGKAALDDEMAQLANRTPGERNTEANLSAYRIGRLVGGRCLTFSEAYRALEAAVLSWGVSPRDKALGPKGTLARALRVGEQYPRGPDDTNAPMVEIRLGEEEFDQGTGELPTLPPKASPGELPEHLTHLPGLVGALTDWITDTALYPQRGLSLGAALTLVGTAAGRHLAGPTRSGTHLYVVCLAPSGAGKDHPLNAIAPILDAAGMRAHIGPSQFISMPAVIRFLQRVPLSVCAMDEFGSFLKRINSRRASGFEGAISGMLRTAWGCSFKAMATPEWAQQNSATIFSPALSIYGAVTAPDFYSSLEGADVTNGILNRFLVIETKSEPQERAPLADPTAVPKSISDSLRAIYQRNPLAMLCQSEKSPAYDCLAITADAEQIRRGLVEQIRKEAVEDRTLAPFLARTAENAIRLATIMAIGRASTQIDATDMAWARELALWATRTLAHGAGLYIADSDTQAAANAVRRAIQERGGRVKRRDLLQAMKHRYKRRELDDVIMGLAEAEDILIEKIVPEGGGTPSFFYSIRT